MKKLFTSILATASLAVGAAPGQTAPPGSVVTYHGHKHVRVTVRDVRELRTALALTDDVWTCRGVGVGSWEARFTPAQFEALVQTGIEHEVLDDDLQRTVDAERTRLCAGGTGGPDGPWFADFKDLASISAYVDTLAALRPDLATRITLGPSLQNRLIFGIRITNGAFNPGRCKPGLYLFSTQHAREWITPMVSMYYADRLIRTYDTDPYVRDLVDHVEFFIVPVANPDGYQYSWDVERFWRKNRRPNAGGSFGVDNNRNWGYQWGGAGASSLPTSETYRGTAPFSEPENQVLRDFALSKPNLRSANDIHSAAQQILWPWAYTSSLPPAQPTFLHIGTIMRQRILAVHGLSFVVGPVYTTIYPASGDAGDWLYGERGIYQLSYELRGPGFAPPPSAIMLAGEETFPATMYQAEWIAQQFPFAADFNNDCVYTVADFGAFQTGFVAGDPRADFTGDGQLTVADFGAFQTAWVQGR